MRGHNSGPDPAPEGFKFCEQVKVFRRLTTERTFTTQILLNLTKIIFNLTKIILNFTKQIDKIINTWGIELKVYWANGQFHWLENQFSHMKHIPLQTKSLLLRSNKPPGVEFCKILRNPGLTTLQL